MSVLKKLASQTAVYGLSNIAGRFINYLLVPLQTSLFIASEYGINTMLYGYVTFFNVLLTYGMETAFFRFSQKSNDPKQVYSTALTSLICSSLAFIVLFSGFSVPLAGWLHIPDHPEYIVYFTLIIAFDAICAVPFAYLRQQNKAMKFALIKNINIFVNILLNLYFLLLCPYAQKSWNMLLPFYEGHIHMGQVFIANLVASVITIPLLLKEILEIRNASFNKTLWKEMLRYALPLMVVGFAGMINEALDRTILMYFYDDAQEGLAATGIYGANYKLSILMTLFIQAFRYAAEPFFFSHAKTDDKRDVYARVMDYFVLVCLFLFLVVTLFIDQFKYFIDKSYWSGLHVVAPLLVANMFLGIYYNLSIWYKLSDQTNKGAVISLAGAGITIAANLVLVPLLGYTGSAWATLICYVCMTVICYVMGMKYYPIPYHVWRVLLFIGVALLLYFIGIRFQPYVTGVSRYAFNASLIAVFLGWSWFAEKRDLLRVTKQ